MEQFKTKPYRHQLDCLNKFGGREFYALFADMGTGKTWIIINDIAKLWASGSCDSLLIFAPNGVHSNWIINEIPKHMPDWVDYRTTYWDSSSKDKVMQRILFSSEGELRILAMNWEGLQYERSFNFAMKFALNSGRLMIACDESDAIKNHKAMRTKRLMKFKNLANYRRILSGTPISNSPADLFTQFNFLDQNIFGNSFYSFQSEYFILLKPGNPIYENARSRMRFGAPSIIAKDKNGMVRVKHLDKLIKRITPHVFRVEKKDCLDIPDKIYKTIYFDLSEEQRKIYNKLKKEYQIEYEQKTAIFEKIVIISKLAQITSGYYIHPDFPEPIRIDGKNPRLELLIERIKTISGKIIIWAKYTVEIEEIYERLKNDYKCAKYYGKTTKKERLEVLKDFEEGDTKIFIGNQKAGGVGLTLNAASYVIYFSNNFSFRDRSQSEDRSHRIGQNKNVIYIDLIARQTIDEIIRKAIQNKKKISEIIIDNGLKLFK